MATKCDFCHNNKLKASEVSFVKEVVIDKNPGIIKLTDVLVDLYFCELDVSKICSQCMDKISKEFIYKQELRKRNKNMPQLNIIMQISKFLNKTKDVAISEHLDILSIYPAHRKQLVETIKNITPSVSIDKKLPEKNVFEPRVVLPRLSETPRRSDTKTVTFAPTTSFIKNSTYISSSEPDSDGSNYGEKKSKKRKKKTKTPGNAKKQKTSNNSFIVNLPEGKNNHSTIIEFTKSDEDSDVDYKSHGDEQSRKSDTFNSSGLEKSLTVEQKKWLNYVITTTDRCGDNFSCKFCFKNLLSLTAMKYHYINLHLLKKLTKKKVWVGHKIKEGIFQMKLEDGRKVTRWRCTECSKVYSYQSAIRYHLTKHLKDDFDEAIDTSL